jgi:biotin carboxyl carrier protein
VSASRSGLRLTVAGLEEAPLHRTTHGHVSGTAAASIAGHAPAPEVRVLPRTAADRASGVARYEVTVDGWVLVVAVEDEQRAQLRERATAGAARRGVVGSDVVHAAIPGRVVRLWVAEGDTVEAGQRLLAIEAMKMENEVRAPRAGMVTAIRVAPGDAVELRDELLTVRE